MIAMKADERTGRHAPEQCVPKARDPLPRASMGLERRRRGPGSTDLDGEQERERVASGLGRVRRRFVLRYHGHG